MTNKYQVLLNLIQDEENNQQTVEMMWQTAKNARQKTCEEQLGKFKQQQKSWFSALSLHKMDERRQLKAEVNNARTRNKKKRGAGKYQEINKEVRKSISKINANICRTW